MTLVCGSVCSGIEAATSAWHLLGWRPSFFSEIEPFPRAVLQHHYPHVPLHGDFTTIEADQYEPIDLLVGGTPCQSFSIAGLRGGLDDNRGNLALEFLRLAQRLHPRWVVWENVPGVLSSHGGRDFGSILGGLVEVGYGFAYRVLDAQYFGVAQRRRRVFVVGHLGDATRSAAVLFERHSLSGHPAPRRQQPEEVAVTIARSSYSGGAGGRPEGAAVNHFISARMVSFGEYQIDGTASTIKQRDYKDATDLVVSFQPRIGRNGRGYSEDVVPALNGADAGATSDMRPCVAASDMVRRLTPIECERLQGFPDNHTAIPWRKKPADECPDGPRYKALGNSMAVPVMRWIGERISMVEGIAA